MAKQTWKPGNMIYPLPAVMVSVGNPEGDTNIITIAWTGTICTNPAMLYISVRPERHSYSMIKETGEFVINLTTSDLAYATDWCGVKSGRDVDKWKEMKLTPVKAEKLEFAPMIDECPVQIHGLEIPREGYKKFRRTLNGYAVVYVVKGPDEDLHQKNR